MAINSASAQKVGLVFSGGGVRGMAHLGVIKALEEEKIPIDYITGTSAGALVGSMYAIGMTPQQIERVLISSDFIKWAGGIYDEENTYYFLKNPNDPSWASIKLMIDSILKTQLPSNIVNPAEIDFSLMETMAAPSALAKYDFDSLLIPFRCVAADITAKKPVTFKNGDLALAVRASMAFPFYFSPILQGKNILYDGGIYNNFPTDIMLNEFNPDIILGVSVAGLPEIPSEGNFLSQLKTMIAQHTAYTVPREQDILIEPKLSDIGTFEFNSVRLAIDSGYAATKRMIPQIKASLSRTADTEKLKERRNYFQNSMFQISIDNIIVDGVNADQGTYIRTVLNPKNECLSVNQLRKNWFQLVTDENISYLFPRLIYNPASGNYDLHLDVRKNKGIKLDFGGLVSSKPINTGFVSVQRNFWGLQSVRMLGNFYFGKLYNSAHFDLRFYVPGSFPFYIEPSVTVSQYDFYKSSTAFFGDVKPSFLVQYERNYGLNLGLPVKNKGKVVSGINLYRNNDRYYITRQFSENDTADQTSLEGVSAYLFFERNTLNKKFYADEGTFFEFRTRFTTAEEYTRPGNTKILADTIKENHQWFQLLMKYENYFKTVNWYTAGIYLEMNFSGMPFLSNYVNTKSQMPAFSPIPEMQTLFLESYRANNFMGFGIKNIFNITKDFDLRVEGYVFQPFQEVLPKINNKPSYGDAFNKRYLCGTLNAVYQSPVGPISLAVNYIEEKEKPVSIVFHIGYFLFNRRSIQ
jgi:NTE family protein